MPDCRSYYSIKYPVYHIPLQQRDNKNGCLSCLFALSRHCTAVSIDKLLHDGEVQAEVIIPVCRESAVEDPGSDSLLDSLFAPSPVI